MAASNKGWFKSVDKGKHLAEFLLARREFKTGPVADTVALLREHIYFRPAPPAEPEVLGEAHVEVSDTTECATQVPS